MSSLSETGPSDICTQVTKSSFETWTLPVQLVSTVLVETVDVSMASSKLTVIPVSISIFRLLSDGVEVIEIGLTKKPSGVV